jgi:hypothetical protein
MSRCTALDVLGFRSFIRHAATSSRLLPLTYTVKLLDTIQIVLLMSASLLGCAVAQLVEALRYKPEVRGFDSRWSHWNFSVT